MAASDYRVRRKTGRFRFEVFQRPAKGRVFYQEFPTYRNDQTVVPTPIFAMSFDAIVSDAEARNHTFLEILRSMMKQHSGMLSEVKS